MALRFARRVVFKVKPGKASEFVSSVRRKVLPSFRREKGLRRWYLLESPASREVVSLTLWDSRSNAEAYGRSGRYAKNVAAVRDLVDAEPAVSTLDVLLHVVGVQFGKPKKRRKKPSKS